MKKRTNFRFFLLNPHFETIAELFDIIDPIITKNINGIHELSFAISPETMSEHELLKNPLIDLVRSHYIIEAVSDWETLYFLIEQKDISQDRNSNNINFSIQSYARQLSKDIIFEYDEISKTLEQVATDLLENSAWEVGYVDSAFHNVFRSFTFQKQTTLEALMEIARVYNALIMWREKEKKVEFFLPSRFGVDKGFVISDRNYKESSQISFDYGEITTRLYVYGKDNLSIARRTPTGSPYLEDFSYFLYPFEMDENDNVIKKSHYMTDGLAIAVIKYQKVLEANQGEFDRILDERKVIEENINSKMFELTELLIQLQAINDSLDILKSENLYPDRIAEKTAERNAKEVEVDAKRAEIRALDSQLDVLDQEVANLNTVLKKESNFTVAQLRELDNFTISRIFEDSSVEDLDDLLSDGIDAFTKFKNPLVTGSVNLTNFLKNEEYQFDWNKLDLGDVITVHNSKLDIDIIAQIHSVVYNLTDNTVSVDLANERYEIGDMDDFTKKIYASIGTSTTVNMDKYKWDMAEGAMDGVTQIRNNAWDATKNAIQGGVDNTVTISERGLIIKSSENPMKWLVAQNGVLALTQDGGETWKTAITPDGVYAERLVGRLILGNQLVIEDENGIISMVGDKMTVTDPQGRDRAVIGKYADNKYGLKIDNGALEIVGGLTSDNISQELRDDLVYDDSALRADLRLTAPLPNSITLNSSGITASTSNSNTFARLDYRGLYVQGGAIDLRTNGSSNNRGMTISSSGIKGYNSQGTQTYGLDSDGNFFANTGTFGGNLSAAGGTFSGNLSAAGGTFSGTLAAANGSFTGSLTGNIITGSYINGGSIDVDGNQGRFNVNNNGHVVIEGKESGRTSRLTLDNTGIEIFNSVTGWENSLFLSPTLMSTPTGFEISTMGRLKIAAGHALDIGASNYVSIGTGDRMDITSGEDLRIETQRAMTLQSGSFARLRLRGSTIDFERQNVSFLNANVTGLSVVVPEVDYRRTLQLASNRYGASLDWIGTSTCVITASSGGKLSWPVSYTEP